VDMAVVAGEETMGMMTPLHLTMPNRHDTPAAATIRSPRRELRVNAGSKDGNQDFGQELPQVLLPAGSRGIEEVVAVVGMIRVWVALGKEAPPRDPVDQVARALDSAGRPDGKAKARAGECQR
jgi:hypothetical protein